jgi:hypothetical protein
MCVHRASIQNKKKRSSARHRCPSTMYHQMMRLLGGVIIVVLLAGSAEAGKRQRAAGIALTAIGATLTFTGIGLSAPAGDYSCSSFGCPAAYNALLGSGITAVTLGQLSIVVGAALWGSSGRGEPIEADRSVGRRRAMFESGLLLTGLGVGSLAVGVSLLATQNAGLYGLGSAPLLGLGSLFVVIGVPLAIVGRPRTASPKVALAPVRGGAVGTLALSF